MMMRCISIVTLCLRFQLTLFAISLLLIVVSCGGSGGGGSTSASTDSDAPVTSPLPSEAPTNTQYAAFETAYENNGERLSATVNGVEFSSLVSTHQNDQPIMRQALLGDEKMGYIAIDGVNVNGFGASYDHATNGTQFAFYGLEGHASQTLPTNSAYTYDGVYMRANAADPANAILNQRIFLEVDFASGQIIGGDIGATEAFYEVDFAGNIVGRSVSLNVYDVYGTHQAEGAFFGSNAEEIAAGYQDGQYSGLIYGRR